MFSGGYFIARTNGSYNGFKQDLFFSGNFLTLNLLLAIWTTISKLTLMLTSFLHLSLIFCKPALSNLGLFNPDVCIP